MGIRVSRRRRPNWMLAALIGISVVIHALVFWWFAGDFHPAGTGAAEVVVLTPGLAGEAVAVPRPPAPLAPGEPDIPHNQEDRALSALGAVPPQAPVVKWKGGHKASVNKASTISDVSGGAAKPAAGHKASVNKASTISDVSGGAADSKKNYLTMVRQKIAKMRNYPVTAQLRHQTGMVVVGFSIRADGRAENVKIVSGSRTASLDNAALDAVISASPFPPLPKGLPEKRLVVKVPIRFELTRR